MTLLATALALKWLLFRHWSGMATGDMAEADQAASGS
jgi:hypothetical protein